MLFRASVAALSAALLVATGSLRQPARAQPHVLKFADGLDLTALNPLLPQAAPDNRLNWITMAYLMRYGDKGMQPELARQLPTQHNGGIAADGKTIVYHLRPNTKWSDGAPLTSDDVAFTVALINDPKTNTIYREGFQYITRVDTPDATTAVFHLSQPYGRALDRFFGARSAPILPKHRLAGTDFNTSAYLTLPLGAGPFRYTKWLRGDRVELEPNPYYFGGRPKLARIVFKMIPTTQGSLIALRAGAVTLVLTQAYADYQPLEHMAGIHAVIVSGVRPSLLALNTQNAILSDVSVRRALRLGTDRAGILQRTFLGGGILAETPVAVADRNAAHIPLVRYDIYAAQRALDKAGWIPATDGVRAKDGRRLQLELIGASPGGGLVGQILESVRADWKKLGIEVSTKLYPLSLMFSPASQGGIVYGGKFDVALFSFGEQQAEDLGNLVTCRTIAPKGMNFWRLCDRRVDALLDRADALYDDRSAGTLREQAQRLVFDDAPLILIALRNEYHLYADGVTGLDFPPFAFFPDATKVDVTR